jgi:predicted PhzF superfamily epimerase YddE/YHI9
LGAALRKRRAGTTYGRLPRDVMQVRLGRCSRIELALQEDEKTETVWLLGEARALW